MFKYTSLDANGDPFSRPAFLLDYREYSKIISEINQIYESQYKDKHTAAHPSFGIDGNAYVYSENHGFDNYNIYFRVIDNH